ncbi:unnamed protein product [Caenorhabditis sp. 36 PRJEB53466]|nr:unnamed protein product [Caenorhabditis sp. 36 PRJEB53466]
MEAHKCWRRIRIEDVETAEGEAGIEVVAEDPKTETFAEKDEVDTEEEDAEVTAGIVDDTKARRLREETETEEEETIEEAHETTTEIMREVTENNTEANSPPEGTPAMEEEGAERTEEDTAVNGLIGENFIETETTSMHIRKAAMHAEVANGTDTEERAKVGAETVVEEEGLVAEQEMDTDDPNATIIREEDNSGNMNQQQNPRLAINIFGLQLSKRTIFRHVVQIKLFDQKTKKDYILTTMSARGRGSRASKQSDNFILLGQLLDKWNEKRTGSPERLIFAYDGAQSLFALEGICHSIEIPKEEALQIPGISDFLKDSINFLDGCIQISCDPDQEKASFNQTELNEWSDPRFYAYLDIVTSQSAIRSGKYLSQSKGLYVNTKYMEKLRVGWAVAAKGIHKGCRVVGTTAPLPILELDPQSTQYYAPIPLSDMLQLAFPRDFPHNRIITPNQRLQRAVKLLMKELKCNPYYEDLANWATNTIIITDIDYNAPRDTEYREKYPNLKYPLLPAAICGIGPRKRMMPLEYLKVLPFQSIDRRVLEEFELTPRANAPEERWKTLQNHYEEFGFNDEVMTAFGVTICNDPFSNISYIDGERVAKPNIAYADPVHVDDEKRDWKAQDKKFSTPAKIDRLVLVLAAGYSRNFDAEKKAVEFVARAFMQRCKDKGMQIVDFDFKYHEGERDCETFLTSIFKDLYTHPKYNSPSFMPFVLFVSDDIPNIHECLKFEERIVDIPTQHVLLKNIRKIRDNMEKKSQGGRRAYDLTLDNIVMKANVKCGGLNYIAIPKDIACWESVSTFVMGMDVAHPDRVAVREGSPSTVGLSCNSAESPYQFIGDFHYTEPRREAIQDQILRHFTAQNVRSFAELRGFPKKIIIFRDGVSFGEESEALREVQVIESTIIEAARDQGVFDYAPKVLAVVVKKRHHTRFYGKGGYQGSQPTNPLPDTSVGGEIAEYGKRQIFIQAFRPVQGTAKVPSFLIIRDDENVSDDHISKLVCAVCSLHQLVNSPTSIPTPVYVAHEFAKRGTSMLKAYKYKRGDLIDDWFTLTNALSYSTLDRLSRMRVCIPGIVAAVLSAIVFFRLRHSSLEVLLCGLSLFDVVLLTSSIMIYPSMHQCSRIHEPSERHNSFVCHFFWRVTVLIFPLSLIAQAGSVWTYVAVTVDRFIAVCFPLKKRVWFTRSNSTTVLICITFVSTLFKLPSFFEVQLDQNGEVGPTELRKNEFYIEFYLFYLYVALIQLIPWTLIIFLNAIIIHKVRIAYRAQEGMVHKSAKPKTKREDAERKVTVMATVMTGIFIICNIPPGINYLVDKYSKSPVYRQRIPLSNLLVCVNRHVLSFCRSPPSSASFSASNMMIYCVFNSRFRRAALKLLGCPSLAPTRAGSVVTRLTRDETAGMLRFRVTTLENLHARSPETAC